MIESQKVTLRQVNQLNGSLMNIAKIARGCGCCSAGKSFQEIIVSQKLSDTMRLKISSENFERFS